LVNFYPVSFSTIFVLNFMTSSGLGLHWQHDIYGRSSMVYSCKCSASLQRMRCAVLINLMTVNNGQW